MTWVVSNSATQTAVISTEHTLTTDTTNATFVFFVDTTNMVLGDTLELRVYTKVLSGGALDQVWKGTFSNVQTDLVKQSPPVPSDQSIKITLKQVAGTGRNFDWKLLRI